jgi:hypothetical protein
MNIMGQLAQPKKQAKTNMYMNIKKNKLLEAKSKLLSSERNPMTKYLNTYDLIPDSDQTTTAKTIEIDSVVGLIDKMNVSPILKADATTQTVSTGDIIISKTWEA